MSNYAFFDVDQTIYDGYSTPDFYLYLVSQGFGGDWTIKKDKEIGELYGSGQISYKIAGEKVTQLLADTIKGHEVDEINHFAKQFLMVKNKLKPFAVELITMLKRNDHQTILVSGSTTPSVEAIRHVSGADKILCTKLEIGNNKYTGQVSQMLDDIEKKKAILDEYKLDNPDSIKLGFGDSTGDVPMLSLCDHVFVITPHQEDMIALSKAKRWNLVSNENVLEIVKQILNIPLNR